MQRSRWLLVASAAGLRAPASASADVYSVFSCRDPIGPANEAVGWVGSRSGTGLVSNGCAAGGALTALLGQPRPEGDASASWTFAAPAGTRIVRFATLILPNNVDTRSIQYAYRAVRPGPITSRRTLRLNVRKRNGKLYHRR